MPIIEPVTRVDGVRYGKPTHWYVDDTGAKIPGVTTILSDGLPKPALINWAANTTAEYAVDHWEDLTGLPVSERLKTLKGCRYAERDAAARRGTEVHALAEQLVHGHEVAVPEELAGHVDAYLRFLEEWDPTPVLTEATVYHRSHTYAGTLDLIADLGDGQRWLLDIKTTRSGVYGETALQLAAYRYADRYLDPAGVAQDMPEVDAVGVIWVRADGYSLVPVRADENILTAFRHVAVVASQARRLADLVGEPLTRDGDAA